MSKHTVAGVDLSGLFERFSRLQEKARARTGQDYQIIESPRPSLSLMETR